MVANDTVYFNKIGNVLALRRAYLVYVVARISRMEEDIELLFEIAEEKYGQNQWLPQEKFVDFIYNETQVIQEVEALDALENQ